MTSIIEKFVGFRRRNGQPLRRHKNHPDKEQINHGRKKLYTQNWYDLVCAAETALLCMKPRMFCNLRTGEEAYGRLNERVHNKITRKDFKGLQAELKEMYNLWEKI